jgi:CubicO group peptidase (beta-lactamase class C family)
MRSLRVLIFACVSCYTFTVSSSIARELSATDRLLQAYEQPGSPAIAVAVAQNGKVVYRRALGDADIANGVSATLRTAFEIGSVSKMFTALAVERLIHEGRLSADDDVRQFIPELPQYEAPVTVRHLLQHTSGIRDYFELLGMRGFRFDDSTTQDEVVRLIERQREINFPPGSDYAYSNSGYVLLAKIIEKVIGQSFAAYMHQTIFAPLGMSEAQFLADRTHLIRNKAQSYIAIGKAVISLPFNSDVNGPCGAWMSAEDLAKWLGFLDALAEKNDSAFAAMSKPVELPNGRTLNSGEGLYRGVHNGYAELLHDGGDSGYRSVGMLFPGQHLGIAIEANSPSEDLVKLAETIADNFLPRQLGSAGDTRAASATDPAPNTAGAKPTIAGIQGVYRSEELDTTYTLRLEEDHLFADHIRNASIELTPTGPDTWTGGIWWCTTLVVERNAAGDVSGFRMLGFRARKGVLFHRVS